VITNRHWLSALTARSLTADIGLIRALGSYYRANPKLGKEAPEMTEIAPAARQSVSIPRRLLLPIALAVLLSAIGYALRWHLIGSSRVTTDDAYVGGDTAQITPMISAMVRAVLKSDTDAVQVGDVLIVLDDADARKTLDQTELELDRAIRRARGYNATNRSLEAQIAARVADMMRAERRVSQALWALKKAQSELDHHAALMDRSAVAGEAVTAARHAKLTAEANLLSTRAALAQAHANQTAAQASLAANETLTSGAALADDHEVALARAKRDQAQLDASRALLRAPFGGVIARRQVQVGQRVNSGTTLMTVVPVGNLYVNANFKEAQLRTIKQGQTAELTSGTYGSSVTYHGKVMGLSANTESRFALVSAQNGAGYWTKVVQRILVRISLDPAELRANPLAIGTPISVTVNLGS